MALILSLQANTPSTDKPRYSKSGPSTRNLIIVAWLLAILLQLLALPLLAADLTIDDGVVVKLGADAQLTVRDRITVGKGIILTSQKDDSVIGQLGVSSQTPQLGDWQGLRLEKSAAAYGALTIDELAIRYAGATPNSNPSAALTVRGWSPTLKNLQITDNSMGLLVLDGAAPTISASSFLRNSTGLQADNNSKPKVSSSQFIGNTALAINNKTPATIITATDNWWGHASGPKEATANPGGQGDAISTGVDFDDFKNALTLFNASVRLAEPASYFDQHTIMLDLSCINATEYRIAESDSFTNATTAPLSNDRAQVPFTLSEGDGNKPISVEFKNADGLTAIATLANGVLIDTQAPTVQITNPGNGSQINQSIVIEANATDAAGVAKLEFYIDGQRVATKTASPYTFNWNTASVTDGQHTIKVVATDIAGRSSEQSATVTFTKIIPPADSQGPQLGNVAVDAVPLVNGAVLTRNSTISFTASDASGLSRVDLLLDGNSVGSPSGNTSYSAVLNLDNVANGSHILAVQAKDSLGNLSTLSYNITVAHAPPAAPVLTQPVNNTTTRDSSVTVSGKAQPGSDVRLYVNAAANGAANKVPNNGQFSTTLALANGNNEIQATATDAYGTSPASLTIVVTRDSSIPSSPSNLSAVGQAGGKIRLSWTKSTDPNAIGYDLYRATSTFDDIASASKVNTTLLTVTALEDLPSQDGTWFYGVVSVNKLGTPSVLSNIAQAVSDNTLPKALTISYTPQGQVDPDTGAIGQGKVLVQLTASEDLPSVPFLSLVPQGGSPLPVLLTQASNKTYQGSFIVSPTTPSGVATALFSARDAVGNRGTEIDAGATLKFDTAGPMLSGIALDPGSPINNVNSQVVEATLSFSKPAKTTPEVNVKLSGQGRALIPLTDLTKDHATIWVGSFTLPADAGLSDPETLTFSFKAEDSLGNVATKVLDSNRFQVYQGNLPPLNVPFAFTAKAQPAGKVKLAWQAVDEASAYQLYRQAPGQTELQPLTRVSGTAYLDQTPEDGTYQYAVASVRKANSQEALSGQSPTVTVVASATPPQAPRSLTLKMAGQGIVATWLAPSQGNVDSYKLYRASGTSITDIDGLTPLKTGIKTLATVDAQPNPNQGAYVVTALDAAGNESVLSNSAYLNASLLPVPQLKIEQVGNDSPNLSWVAPNGNVTSYKVYADIGANPEKTLLTPNPITTLNFTDTGYSSGERLYTVASVDAAGVEMPHNLLLPSITATITSGLPIQRGVLNQLQIQVGNNSNVPLNNVRVVVRLPIDKLATQFKDHPSQPINLTAKQTRVVPLVVGGYAELPDLANAQVRIEIAPNEGELVTLAQNQEVNVTEGSLVVGMSTYEFTRGATGKLKLTIENTTDTEVELLTAKQNGSEASSELRFKILDKDGNVLATQPLKQVLGANVVSLNNGLTVARIPAHANYVSDEFLLDIPAASPTNIRVKLEVDKLRYHSGKDDEVIIAGRGSEKTLSLVDTAYFGEVTQVSPVSSFGDQDITITGKAIDHATNTPLPNTTLKLVLNQQGFERVFSTLTDSTGQYSYTFKPTLTDSGLYKVSAVHPETTDRPEHKSFTINRITVSPSPFKLDIPKNYLFTVPYKAKAGPGSAATNLKLTLDAASQATGQLPNGINVSLPAPVNVGNNQSVDLPVVFTASNEAQVSGSLILNVRSDEHPNSPVGQVKIDYNLSDAKPFLTSTPSFVETGLASGSSQIESVIVQNKGLQDASNLVFKLTKEDGSPAPSWVGITSKSDGTLALGGKRTVDLSFNPPEGTSDGVYKFKLAVLGDNVSQQALNVFISVSQSGKGNALFKAADIYTATVDKNGQLIQGLANANISVQNEDVPTITQELNTDALGEALFQDLPAGRYKFRAKATNHQELGGRLLVKPGITVNQPVFLSYNLITVDWSVREISIQDRYEITLNATFETDVPAPVVVLQPASVNLPKMGAGDVFYGELTLTNHGLIGAEDVVAKLPGSDGYFRYEFLVDIPATLEAKQRLTIPYRIVALQSLEASASSATASGGGCYSYSNSLVTSYGFTCANGEPSSGSASTSWFSGSNSSCPGGSGGGGGGWVGSGGGGGWGGGSVGNSLPGTQSSCKKTPGGNGGGCS